MIPAAFYGSALLVIVTPGPDLALLTGMLVSFRRRRPAFGAAAGMVCAGAVYAVLGIVGVSALLASRPGLVTALRLGGALVLGCYGAVTLVRLVRLARRGDHADFEQAVPGSTARSFAIGFLSTITNPKVGVFLLAFLPQFLAPGRSATAGLSVLAAVYLALVAAWLSTYIVLAQRLCRVFAHPRGRVLLEFAVGCVLLWLGARMALG